MKQHSTPAEHWPEAVWHISNWRCKRQKLYLHDDVWCEHTPVNRPVSRFSRNVPEVEEITAVSTLEVIYYRLLKECKVLGPISSDTQLCPVAGKQCFYIRLSWFLNLPLGAFMLILKASWNRWRPGTNDRIVDLPTCLVVLLVIEIHLVVHRLRISAYQATTCCYRRGRTMPNHVLHSKRTITCYIGRLVVHDL